MSPKHQMIVRRAVAAYIVGIDQYEDRQIPVDDENALSRSLLFDLFEVGGYEAAKDFVLAMTKLAEEQQENVLILGPHAQFIELLVERGDIALARQEAYRYANDTSGMYPHPAFHLIDIAQMRPDPESVLLALNESLTIDDPSDKMDALYALVRLFDSDVAFATLGTMARSLADHNQHLLAAGAFSRLGELDLTSDAHWLAADRHASCLEAIERDNSYNVLISRLTQTRPPSEARAIVARMTETGRQRFAHYQRQRDRSLN